MTSERTFADELTIESLTHHCNDLRTQLAAAREALSNANERALAYDDELRTLRHRAERMERVVEAAQAIKEAVDVQYLDGEPSRIGHADSSLFVALDREIRTLDDASAGEP